ncbi:hypothetical protein [Halorubrum sp. DTA98]|uniref:hypothetical protein n=1 Tax=Halorubrum sp. DTA98 TaxID=3402163 RepID=UPI003AADB98E
MDPPSARTRSGGSAGAAAAEPRDDEERIDRVDRDAVEHASPLVDVLPNDRRIHCSSSAPVSASDARHPSMTVPPACPTPMSAGFTPRIP